MRFRQGEVLFCAVHRWQRNSTFAVFVSASLVLSGCEPKYPDEFLNQAIRDAKAWPGGPGRPDAERVDRANRTGDGGAEVLVTRRWNRGCLTQVRWAFRFNPDGTMDKKRTDVIRDDRYEADMARCLGKSR
jgi:hypothetical protein